MCNNDIKGIDDALRRIEAGSAVPHVMLWRYASTDKKYELPNYDTDPRWAADDYYVILNSVVHPRIMAQRDKVWIALANEPDKNRSDWLGQWGYESAKIWNEQGFKVALFGFSSGEPESEHWRTPGMRKFLEYAGQNRDKVAVNLHEYSFNTGDIWEIYPYRIGRFQFLFKECDNMGLIRPSVIFGEWGWQNNAVPSSASAISDIKNVAHLYTKFDSILGAGIWYLGKAQDSGDIHNKVQQYISPLTTASVDYFPGVPRYNSGNEVIPIVSPIEVPPPPPQGNYKAVIVKMPQEMTLDEWMVGAEYAYKDYKRTLTASTDDAKNLAALGNSESYVKIVEPELASQKEAIEIIESAGLKWEPLYLFSSPPVKPVKFERWPTDYRKINQFFGANPQDYEKYGFPGHEGIDVAAPNGTPYYAVADGVVIKADNLRSDGTVSLYGYHVIIDHGGWTTLYAHAAANLPVAVGQTVRAGDIVGFSGSTGNSTGPHLHLTLKIAGYQLTGWPAGYADPWPYLQGLYCSEPTIINPVRGYLWAASMDKCSTTVAVAKSGLNMREYPNSSSKLIGTVESFRPLRVLRQQTEGTGYYFCEAHITGVSPSKPAVDMVPYFFPPSGKSQIVILSNNWGYADERVQTLIVGGKAYLTKNNLVEVRSLTQDFIKFELDTSYGLGKYYTVDGKPGWLPKKMSPGDSLERVEYVRLFTMDKCQQTDAYSQSSYMRFAGLLSWTSPYGVTLQDVAELQWIMNGMHIESYYYWGGTLVGWANNEGRKSGVRSIIPVGQQQDNPIILPDCL